MNVTDVHVSDDCRDGSTGVRSIGSTKEPSTKLRSNRAARGSMSRRHMTRKGNIGAQQEQLAHAVSPAHNASTFTAPADKRVKVWSPSNTLTTSCVISLLGGAPKISDEELMESSSNLIRAQIQHMADAKVEEVIEEVLDDCDEFGELQRAEWHKKFTAERTHEEAVSGLIKHYPVDKEGIIDGLQTGSVTTHQVLGRLESWFMESYVKYTKHIWTLDELGRRFEITLRQLDANRCEHWRSELMTALIPEGRRKDRMIQELCEWPQLQRMSMSWNQLMSMTPAEERADRRRREIS